MVLRRKLFFALSLLSLVILGGPFLFVSIHRTHAVSPTPHLASASSAIIVDPTTTPYKPFEGWGTSLAWWAEAVGRNPTTTASIDSALFDPPNPTHPEQGGLGFNVVRYNFGAYTSVNKCPTAFRDFGFASVPSYEPTLGQFDPKADPAQLAVLQDAQHRGANIFEGFANSAPAYMLEKNYTTGSGPCTQGNYVHPDQNNLKSDEEQNYAIYLADIVKHFHDDFNITFQTVEPFNEPDGKWPNDPTAQSQQEGMHVEITQQSNVIQDLDYELQQNGASNYTSISAADDNNIDNAVNDFNCDYHKACYNPATQADVAQLNTHSYNGTQRNAYYHIGADKTISMSEYTTDATDFLGPVSPPCVKIPRGTGSPTNMTGALALSCQILNDMSNMHPQTWSYWQAVESNDTPSAYGLLQTHFQASNPAYTCPSNPSLPFCYAKQYYAMAQYSKFIRPGFQQISIDRADALAFYDPPSQKLEIVVTNTGNNKEPLTFDLTKFTSITGPATAYQTDGNLGNGQQSCSPDAENLCQIQDNSLKFANNMLIDTVPPQSITTYDIFGVSGVAPVANLLVNGDFETPDSSGNATLSPWQGQWNPSDAGVEACFPYSGLYDAYLHPTSTQDVGVEQTITAPQDGQTHTYLLTAYAAANYIALGGVQLGVKLDNNDQEQYSVVIKPNIGYRYYPVSFSASPGQSIEVWYYANTASGSISPPCSLPTSQQNQLHAKTASGSSTNWDWATLDDVVLSITS